MRLRAWHAARARHHSHYGGAPQLRVTAAVPESVPAACHGVETRWQPRGLVVAGAREHRAAAAVATAATEASRGAAAPCCLIRSHGAPFPTSGDGRGANRDAARFAFASSEMAHESSIRVVHPPPTAASRHLSCHPVLPWHGFRRASTETALPTAVAGRSCFSTMPASQPERIVTAAGVELNTAAQPPGVTRLLKTYADIPPERTRTFSIVAHIDHGKSTLADKLMEATGNIWPTSKGRQQVLDNLAVERARGITIHSQSASLVYTRPSDGQSYLLNLIDTPGHVDFGYEVTRALAAANGALLLVDCTQGVQAQTVSNYNAARNAGCTIVPLLTKIDLPTADPEPALAGLEATFGIAEREVLWTSAKTGSGIPEVFESVVSRFGPPCVSADRDAPLRCRLLDSWYDGYRGVICLVQVVQGRLRTGDAIVAAHSGDQFTVQELGLIAPAHVPLPSGGGLAAGHVGYMVAGIKNTRQVVVGDTLHAVGKPVPPLPGFRPAKPMVFASIYPVDAGDFETLEKNVARLRLNDASVTCERESSASLGLGLRCGFLGVLHLQVFAERLQTEFDTPVIISAPMVSYTLHMKDGSTCVVERVSDMPPAEKVVAYLEPTAHVTVIAPSSYVSGLMALLEDRRGVQEDVVYLQSGASMAVITSSAPASTASASGTTTASASGTTPAGGAGDAAAAADVEDADDGDEHDGEGDDERGDQEDEEDGGSDGGSDGNDAAGAHGDDADRAADTMTEALHSTSNSYGKASAFDNAAAAAAPTTAAPTSMDRVVLKYRLPWAEVVTDLHDRVKSLTQGYASMDWLPGEPQEAPIVKVDMLVNTKPVDALSFVAHRDKAVSAGRRVAQKLKSVIKRHQFEVIIQAAVGSKVIARERIAPYRRDVLATRSGKTVGGGDITRKRKLLEKQKEGKKKLRERSVGGVALSQEAFHSVMS